MAKQLVAAEGEETAPVLRDRWNRPLILPPEGHAPDHTVLNGSCSCLKAYTRVTTIAEMLDDKTGLYNWKQRRVAQGLSRRPDLVASASVANERELGRIADMALEFGDASASSTYGSTVHALMERLDRGQEVPSTPKNITAMLLAYEKATKGMTMLGREEFVVQDKIKAAGTYDHLIEWRGERFIGDAKTGQKLRYLALKTCAQVSMYAAAKNYDFATNERTEHGASQERGLLIWCPYVEDAADAFCEIRWLDLVRGREAVRLAMKVREARAQKTSDLLPVVETVEADGAA